MDDPLPRPSLVYFAMSTFLVGLCGVELVREGISITRINAWRALWQIEVYLAVLLIAQGWATFGRSRWAAIASIGILLLAAPIFVPILVRVIVDGDEHFSSRLVLRNAAMTFLGAVVVVANFVWIRTLDQSGKKPRFIWRYSLSELAVIMTMLCAAAALGARPS